MTWEIRAVAEVEAEERELLALELWVDAEDPLLLETMDCPLEVEELRNVSEPCETGVVVSLCGAVTK